MSVFAAVMTGKGTGAIATIQLYGDSAADILKQIFTLQGQKPAEFSTGKILLGTIAAGSETIDQVTIGCEDNNTYAINCHGNPLIVERLMQLLRQQGVELLTAEQLLCKTSAENNTIALEARLTLPKIKTFEGTRIILNQIDSGPEPPWFRAGLTASAKNWLQSPPDKIAVEAQNIIDKICHFRLPDSPRRPAQYRQKHASQSTLRQAKSDCRGHQRHNTRLGLGKLHYRSIGRRTY